MLHIDRKNMTTARDADIMHHVMNVMICNYKITKKFKIIKYYLLFTTTQKIKTMLYVSKYM